DWLLKALPNKNLNNSTAAFYDVNTSISHEINKNNSLFLSGYLIKDNFKLGSDTLYTFGNQNATLRWNHVFSNNLYGVLTGGFSKYNYNITSEQNPVNAFELGYSLDQTNLKADLSYYPNAKHVVDFGANSILYHTKPGSFRPIGKESLVEADVLEREQALESAVYLSDQYEINTRLSVSVGLRYSFYTYMGARSVLQYAPGVPKTEETITDTLHYGAGKAIKTYHGPEYRLSLRYNLTDDMSVKLSYNRMRQYVHMLTNSAMMSPTDVWKLSDAHIRPQVGDQYAIGLFRNFRSNTVEASVEAYYKSMRDFLDSRSGAKLVLNHHIETDVMNARGQAYGIEAMLRKNTGKLNGWVSYTYSRSLVKSSDATSDEVINGGKYYPSNFDKPHDFTFVGNYRFSRRFSTSVNLTYSTGRPITLPLAVYDMEGVKRIYYSDRNQYRIPDYFRTDIALNIEGNHKVRKLAHSSWTVFVYNRSGRKNPYSIYFISEEGKVKGYKLSVFGQPIPTITYNFKF
ncbi:MAG: TonB-dependent receptor, partial [Pontibacter sp.]|nr:TonB-dependent receptor [Pontibacter sp.]